MRNLLIKTITFMNTYNLRDILRCLKQRMITAAMRMTKTPRIPAPMPILAATGRPEPEH